MPKPRRTSVDTASGLSTRQSLPMQNAAMTGNKAHGARLSPLALAIAGGIAIGYFAFLGQMLVTHHWIADAEGRPVAVDFLSFWCAGHLALLGHASAAY